MSVTQLNHMSSTPPRIPVGGTSAGTSIPSGRRTGRGTREVDGVAVRGQEQRRGVHQFRVEEERVVLDADRRNPRRIAANDAPGKL